jgi:HTH-type transcriptional repressor of NAD biosynthesis genes
VAREVVTSNDFTLEDIIKIGYMHVDRIKEKTRTANKILFCDTDAITTQIYCRHYLGSVPQVLFELEKEIIYDQYFLFDIDVPWVNDGMRDLGERRKELFDIFKRELETRNLPYLLVKGDYEERARFVTMEVEKMLSH